MHAFNPPPEAGTSPRTRRSSNIPSALRSTSRPTTHPASGFGLRDSGLGVLLPLLLLYSLTGPRRSLSLKLSDTRIYGPQIRARLVTTAHFCKPRQTYGLDCLMRAIFARQRPVISPEYADFVHPRCQDVTWPNVHHIWL
jgi:hypothetical protein